MGVEDLARVLPGDLGVREIPSRDVSDRDVVGGAVGREVGDAAPERLLVAVGAGDGGAQLASDLYQSGHSIVLVEKNPNAETLLQMRELGVSECLGDASDPAVLRSAAAHRAALIAVLAGDDAMNLSIANAIRITCDKNNQGVVKALVDISDSRLFDVALPASETVSGEELWRLKTVDVAVTRFVRQKLVAMKEDKL